jgi:HEAT repeat protein
MKKRLRFSTIAIAVFATIAFSIAHAYVYAEGKSGEDKKQTLVEEWRDTIRYGIADQILETVAKIKEANETSLNDELATVLQKTINPDLRTAILNYFIDTGFKGAEGIAIERTSTYESEDKPFVILLIKYLASIGSSKTSETADRFLDNADDDLAIAAIQAIGKVKDVAKGDTLLKKLLDVDYPEKRKTQLILALGEMKYGESVQPLIDILSNKEEDKGLRMYACEALGKIGDKRAVDPLKKVFAENDALLKVYAAEALSAFDINEVIDLLIEGLKDSNWKVRVQSAKALAKPNANKAVDILMWKVSKDSVKDVKIASIRALGEIGSSECFNFLRSIAKSETEGISIREVALDVCVNKDFPRSFDTVTTIIKSEWDKPVNKQQFLEITAKYLAVVSSGMLVDVYSKFFDSKNMIVRVYGIRGSAMNGFSSLKKRITEISLHDPVEGVRREAERALGKL